MKLIVGLGNPGAEYAATRHNVGFLAIEELAKRHGDINWRNQQQALTAELRLPDSKLILVKPQTYMNLSGVAVAALMRWYKLTVNDIIVCYDDLDLPLGKLRLRLAGGSGGHRGLESLLGQLGSADFARVRIGIGRPPAGWETADYVLGRFSTAEAEVVAPTIITAAAAIEYAIEHGFTKAMNTYNKN